MKIKTDITTTQRFRLDIARSNRQIISTSLSLLLSYAGIWAKSLWPFCVATGLLGTILSILCHLAEIPPIIYQVTGILIAVASTAFIVTVSHQMMADASLSESGKLQPFRFSKDNIQQLSKSSKIPFIVFLVTSLLALATFYALCSLAVIPDFLLIPSLLSAVLFWLPFHLVAYHHLSFLPSTFVGMQLVKRKPAHQYGHALIIGLCAGTLFLLLTFIISLPFGILHMASILSEHSVMAGDPSDLPGYVPILSYLLSFATLAASTFFLLIVIIPYHLLSYSLRCRYQPKV